VAKSRYLFFPDHDDAGTRLDQFLFLSMKDLSRTVLRKVIDLGGVHVGGRRLRRCSYPVKKGEKVEVFLDSGPLDAFSLSEKDIVFRDPYLLALAKPSGVETQPTPARYRGTLYEALLRFLHNPYRPHDRPELGMVQRLDRETSGIMVFSIHPRAHRGLTGTFSERRVHKVYLALVAGCPEPKQGEFRSLLARKRSTNLMTSVEKGGKEAITRYRVVEGGAEASLVEVEILTGRSHQIRVHFAEAGHPILGDTRYGGTRRLGEHEVPRQMLHAWRLDFRHPVGEEKLELEASPPEDMARLMRALGG